MDVSGEKGNIMKGFSYYIGVKLQNTSITAKEANDRFATTCGMCDCRIPCEKCGINAAHNDAVRRINTAETAKNFGNPG